MYNEEAKNRLESLRNMVFLPLSYLTIGGTGLLAVLSFLTPGGSTGLVEASIAIATTINLFVSFGKRVSTSSASSMLVAIIGVFLAFSLYNYPDENFALYWVPIYPTISILFLGIRRGLVFIGLLIASIIPLMLGQASTSADIADYAILMLAIVVTATLVAYYEHILSVHISLTATRNLEMSDATKKLATEIAQRERAEAQMAEALKKLEENNDELEQARAIDEATISSIGEAVLIVNPQGVIIRANPSAGRVLGLNQEQLINQKIAKSLSFAKQGKEDIILGEEEIAIAQSLQHRSINQGSYQVTKPDSTTFYAQMTSSPLVVGGEVLGAVVVIRDITEEVVVDKAKSEFVSIASHQLRTPLSTINWYLEMVLGGDFGEINDEQREFIGEAAAAGKRMGDLINALLNASRIDVGVVAVEPEELDIRDTLKGVMVDLESKISKRGTKVDIHIDDSVKPMMLDPRIIEIIFLNLISNAVKYSPEKSKVEVHAKIEDFLEISVTDTGYGIPAAVQDKIFTKMFRAENAVEHEPDGNGLGLYIIKSIVETIGGSISFVSKEGEGTTFTVKLPRDGMKARQGAKQLSVKPDM